MKHLVIATLAASAFAVAAVPALAQPRPYNGGQGYNRPTNTAPAPNSSNWGATSAPGEEYRRDDRFGRLQGQIEEGVRRGFLTQQEARSMRQELKQIAQLEANYKRDNRFLPRERNEIERRYDSVSNQIQSQKRSWNGHRRG